MRNSTRSPAGDCTSGRYAAVTAATRACPSLLPTAADGGRDTKEELDMQIKRTALAAIVIAAAAAPNASAMVAGGVDTKPVVQQHTVEPAQGSSRFAEELALRKALRNRELPQAESAPVVPLVHTAADGFDWSSAVIGATVPLALLLAGLLARPALTRRRTRTSALA